MTRARVTRLLLVVVLLAAVAGGGWLLSRSPESNPTSRADTATPTPQAVEPSPAPLEKPAVRKPSCPGTVRSSFDPVDLEIASVGRLPVIHPPRDANGIPGTPPLTTAGKHVFAWDRENGIQPGDEHGNVLLNAHTYPDGSALGNQLLVGLHQGDRIVVHGQGTRLCYRVSERVEVSAAKGLPRYYATDGRPQLAIVVCSGRRFGAGNWENRTIWFASPAT